MAKSSIQEKLKAMAAECGLDWETAKHLSVLTFAVLLERARREKHAVGSMLLDNMLDKYNCN